ncbi:MAG: hypothetical protein G01um101416_863 [Microgenomates group bacterium Gr01-1014_16]|nr:MAG: hypothetical protein G01um101416_863 [Microgenomates group bacterium Gr01-1014_16]
MIDLTKVLKGATSGWVAISADYKKLVAKGKNLREVNKKVEKLPSGSVVLMPVVKNFRNIVTLSVGK